MTVIAAVETSDGVYMAADDRVSGYMPDDSIHHPKIFKVYDGVYLGCSGAARDAQIIQYAELPQLEVDEDDMKFLVNRFVPAIQEALIDAKSMRIKESKLDPDSHFIMSFYGALYRIGFYGFVSRTTRGYESIGSGSAIACGSLHSTATIVQEPESRVAMALEAACELNPHCGLLGAANVQFFPKER